MDVTWQFSDARQFVGWILSIVSDYDHWIQEEEAWSPL